MDAWFDYSCTLTFALPRDEIADRLPPCLTPDTFQDTWGFLAVAAVQTRRLRPAGFPPFLGNDFLLVGYRYFVRYRSSSGRSLRGLYILRSETDKLKMAWLGNIFTRYRYVRTDVRAVEADGTLRISSPRTGFDIEVDLRKEGGLPAGSPFSGWEEARRFSGPLPFTFSYEETSKRVLIVEGVRSAWKPRPVRVISHHIPYLSEIGHPQAVLANAFVVEHIPYHWKKGIAEPWPLP